MAGQGDAIPKRVQTIAIPTFSSGSNRYRLSDSLPNQIAREFTSRTRFHVVLDPAEADAVLRGTINAVSTYATIADPTSGKATTVQAAVTVSLTLTERASGKVLFSRPNLTARSYYEIATDPHQVFDESGPAFDRVSRDLARDIVSAVVENF
ncbi:MAG: hypothetical protein JO061_00455 [Acidobacteriaceae bacterium]|nr:hypothetical protein [Acidobacteriaceae bacterium]